MKRCNTCGHTNGRLRPAKNYYTGQVIPGQFVCMSIKGCIRRMELEGQWVGKRVLRRIDRDGTEWVIRRVREGVSSNVQWWLLTMTYRESRLSSMHRSIDAAKQHAEEFLDSFIESKADDYRIDKPESVDQMELS